MLHRSQNCKLKPNTISNEAPTWFGISKKGMVVFRNNAYNLALGFLSCSYISSDLCFGGSGTLLASLSWLLVDVGLFLVFKPTCTCPGFTVTCPLLCNFCLSFFFLLIMCCAILSWRNRCPERSNCLVCGTGWEELLVADISELEVVLTFGLELSEEVVVVDVVVVVGLELLVCVGKVQEELEVVIVLELVLEVSVVLLFGKDFFLMIFFFTGRRSKSPRSVAFLFFGRLFFASFSKNERSNSQFSRRRLTHLCRDNHLKNFRQFCDLFSIKIKIFTRFCLWHERWSDSWICDSHFTLSQHIKDFTPWFLLSCHYKMLPEISGSGIWYHNLGTTARSKLCNQTCRISAHTQYPKKWYMYLSDTNYNTPQTWQRIFIINSLIINTSSKKKKTFLFVQVHLFQFMH